MEKTTHSLAQELLSPLSESLLYKDRQALRDGDVLGVARRIRRRARVQMGLGTAFGAFMVLQGVMTLMEYPASQSTFGLFFGITAVVFGLVVTFFWTRHSTQMESRAALALEIQNSGTASQNQ